MNYPRRSFIKAVLSSSALSLPFSCFLKANKFPNIIYILADDMGYGDLSCLNSESKIPTPNMDRFAREGMVFTDAHSGSAVCTPTRYGLLTGRYCWRSFLKKGVLGGYSPLLIEENRLTVPAMLKDFGYKTACIGKWHLGLGEAPKTDYNSKLSPGPLEVGFDYFFGIPASLDMIPYVYVKNDRVLEQPTDSIQEKQQGGVFWRGGPIAPGFHFRDVLPTLTEKACTFIKESAENNNSEPFFLYFPLTAPHTPWVPDSHFLGKSRAGLYGDFVTQVDWTIGQVLETLEKCHLTNNTLVFITSDNGSDERFIGEEYSHDANYIFRGQKSDAWDGGHRVPFLVRWPGKIKANSTCNETICLTDLMATLAAILGKDLPYNAGEDSYNLLPALLGESYKTPIREATIHHSINGTFAIRFKEWKLIFCMGSGGWSLSDQDVDKNAAPWQLYNLEKDSQEQENLFNKYPQVVKKLDSMLQKYIQEGRSR